MKKKILVILGTRPEIIRLSCIIQKLNKFFLTNILNTNQNFDKNLNINFFKELGINLPKYNLSYKKKPTTPMQFISGLLLKTDKILEVESLTQSLFWEIPIVAFQLYVQKEEKFRFFT